MKNMIITIRETDIQGIFYTTTRKYNKFMKQLSPGKNKTTPLYDERIINIIVQLQNLNKNSPFNILEEVGMIERSN
jgi:hypothetical protein